MRTVLDVVLGGCIYLWLVDFTDLGVETRSKILLQFSFFMTSG